MTKKQIFKYLKSNELDIQNATANLLILDLAFSAYAKFNLVSGFKFSPIFTYEASGKKSGYYQMTPKRLINDIGSQIYRDYQKNPKKVRELMVAQKRITEEMASLWRKFEIREKKSLSRAEWGEFYRRFKEKSRQWWPYSVLGEDKGEVINREVVPRFARRNKIEINEARRIIMTLSHPAEQSVMNLGRITSLKTSLYLIKKGWSKKSNVELLQDKKVATLVKKYLAQSFWTKTDYYRAHRISAAEFLAKVKEEIINKGKKNLAKELAEIENNFRKIQREKNKILGGLKLTKADKKDLDFSLLIATWIDWRKKWMMEACYYTFTFLEDLAEYLGLSYEEISSYLIAELDEFLKSGKKISVSQVKKRSSEGVFLVFTNELEAPSIFSGQAGKDLFLAAMRQGAESQGLKGFVASSAGQSKISGRVSIVLDLDKDKIKAGDILVTSMTRVEFIPLMRQAKAVITNEGGIACHAAIVSRELGIPAIIGTKNATQKLKTGDNVEMDLKSGIIKIIK
ncbi:MAG: PEP-utilizing enzyme [Patescibacteria group bacterium]|nr:PEP-utilizing enzyme [Patescibacteria group bacterium]